MKNLMRQQRIKKIIKEVNDELERLVDFDDAFIRDCALSTIRAGGKRLRPIFVMLSAEYFGVKNNDVLKFAAIMELVHTASLIHDDVNDNSNLRRGRETINARYDNNVAVHIGVYVLIEALLKVYEVPHSKALLKIMTHTAVEMSRGEVAQLASMFDPNQTVSSYNYRIERKTALLIASCCQCGAILGEARAEEIDAFYRFGHHLGMAFQIKDDLLDLLPDNTDLGKPIGHDLENGLINLSTILLLQKDFPEKVDLIRCIQSRFPNGQADIDRLLPLIQQESILKACEDEILRHIDAAKAILDTFADNSTRALLYEAADYVYERSI